MRLKVIFSALLMLILFTGMSSAAIAKHLHKCCSSCRNAKQGQVKSHLVYDGDRILAEKKQYTYHKYTYYHNHDTWHKHNTHYNSHRYFK